MPGLCIREEEREEQRNQIAREQDWALAHVDRVQQIAKATCAVNEHIGTFPCFDCIKAARRFFVSATLKP